MREYNIIASMDDVTVVAEYKGNDYVHAKNYQSEKELENDFIERLISQGYERLHAKNEDDLVTNLRSQLERLNDYKFTDKEWKSFYDNCIVGQNEGIVEKTRRIQDDHVQLLKRDDGTTKNIYLLSKENVHNNSLQVINQYEENEGRYKSIYDVTILVNGLPLVHIELKRRGISIREAFNQINRYQRDSFWASGGLFEYIQIFVISNGTYTKYYSNTTRSFHVKEHNQSPQRRRSTTSNTFEFTNFWADANNKIIPDLIDFTSTFFAKHTILNVLIKYCVFTSENNLLVMRPYQIAATEKILNRILISHNYKKMGSVEAGGYIWHTTGSGKTLTSFKTAQMASNLGFIDKVIFVVDRKDLDYQTMKEYDRFEKGSADGNTSTKVLQRQLEDKKENGAHYDYKIIVTTIQKLNHFMKANKEHDVYKKNVVLIFDECHRSHFGEMHQAITKKFKKYFIFGFTGTPIFAENASKDYKSIIKTTAQAFGEKLHTYTIVDAINDKNVLPFKIDFIKTISKKDDIDDKKVTAIAKEEVLADPRRIKNIVSYVLEHYDQKTKKAKKYTHLIKWDEKNPQNRNQRIERSEEKTLAGFNSIFATASIPMAKVYYNELKKQIDENNKNLKIATIFSFSPNEEDIEGFLPDEDFNTTALDQSSRDFLEGAIADYNSYFGTAFDTSSDRFENYYKDISQRMKNREIDILVVVNMFLTGFDATTLNTLWVDKNLRQHGLLQAFSRTNRILNSIKTFGNIICFRNLKRATDDSIALFGDKDASGIVLIKTYEEYYNGYEDEYEVYQPGYKELIEKLRTRFPLGEQIVGEEAKKEFINLYGKILRYKNILSSFDEFEGNEILSERDEQNYQSRYVDLYFEFKKDGDSEKESINDDVEFEIELFRQIEVNIDYILILVAKYRDKNCQDKKLRVDIDNAINSSIELRSKKDLIERFIDQISPDGDIDEEWKVYLRNSKEKEIEEIIKQENLNPEKTRKFIERSFKTGNLRTTGTEINDLMPPISRFREQGRDEKKNKIIELLLKIFERFFGLV